MKRILLMVLLSLPTALLAQRVPESIPAGTILPVQLNTSLSSAKSKPGEKVTGRIMQNVPLANGSKIHERTRVIGHVVDVTPSSGGVPGKISVQFDALEMGRRGIPIVTNLRAIASMMDVDDAQEPKFSPDYGTPQAAYATVQIGGEAVYRGGGHVMHGNQVVGDPVPGTGVLVTISASPGTPCRGETEGNTARQALWVFSSDACGVYDLPNLDIAHAGRTDPVGRIVLSAKTGETKVGSGTGMLLRVNPRS
jgi:hypothetical protein